MTPPELVKIVNLKQHETDQKHCVYFLTFHGKVVYVGKTCDLSKRIREHSKAKGKAKKSFNGVWFIPCTVDTMDMYEVIWIAKLKPTYNRIDGHLVNALKQAIKQFRELKRSQRRTASQRRAIPVRGIDQNLRG